VKDATLPTILLVEDNEDDVFVMRHALRKSGIHYPLQVVTDGQMAVNYLAGTEQYLDRDRFPLPFAVFLDLKLPYVHGFEVLSWIGQQPELSSIPVVILTGSAEIKDREKASTLGARFYLVKPPTAETLIKIFDALNGLPREASVLSAIRPKAGLP
jgi:CheY-like chemotaxis protein